MDQPSPQKVVPPLDEVLAWS